MSNKKYLIALDMDGTLLTSDKTISEKTKNYLRKLDKEGHIVVIASGRPIRAIKSYYDDLNLHSPVICYNGACLLSPNDPNFKEISFSFPRDVIKSIYNEVGPKYIENVMCETNKDIWLIKDNQVLADFFWHDGMNIIYGDINETLNENPMTMIIKSYSNESDDLIKAAVLKHSHLCLRFWNGNFALYSEIYYDNVSKAESLKYIAKYYEIPHSNIIAFGDASNDVDMLKMAGIGVAMKNGDDEIKKVANIITDFDNDNDGIVETLKQIIK